MSDHELSRVGNWWSTPSDQSRSTIDKRALSERTRLLAMPDDKQFPRLVQTREADSEELIGLPKQPYQLLAQLMPDVYREMLEFRLDGPAHEALEPAVAKLNQFYSLAEKYGLLGHPVYGDSAFGWATTSLTFQALLRIWAVLDCENDKDDPLGYEASLERLHNLWDAPQVFQLEEKTYGLTAVPRPHIFKPMSPRAYNEKYQELRHQKERPKNLLKELREAKYKFPSKSLLRQRVVEWLRDELNGLFYSTESTKFYLQFDQHESTRTAFRLQGKPLGDHEAFIYFGVQAHLYSCALYTFLNDFNRGGSLKACEGCGRLFLPPRIDARYCPSTAPRCRKRAQRVREASTNTQKP